MIIRRISIISSIFGACLAVNPVYGQIITDDTANTSINNNCQNACEITGGTVAGQNLFHSFEQFNIGAGKAAHFIDPGVTNIFSRVTGSSASEIFGTLGVSGGDANLWLLNPNGIIFGAGAALDINGSFFATTADSIQFGDDRSFSALPNNQDLALLTVDPSALLFNQLGQNHPIEINSGTILSVPTQENITLVGGQNTEADPGISLDFGGIIIPQGDINLAAIKSGGEIGINNNFQLSIPDNVVRGDISLAQGSGVIVNGIGGGNISIQGNNISLAEASNIFTSTLGNIDGDKIDIVGNNLTIAENSTISSNTSGTGKGSDINITAQESVDLVGGGVGKLQQLIAGSVSENLSTEINSSSINTVASANGTSGDITIHSSHLNLNNGAWILATTVNEGNAGNVDISTIESVNLDGSGLITGNDFGSTGDSGNLTIDSNNLLLQNGSIISSSTIGNGNGGDINLNISDSIELRKSLTNGLIPTGIFTNTIFGNGTGGNLTINTSQLVIDDGAELSSASGTFTATDIIPFGGQGGNITVNAADLVKIRGISPDGRFPSGIINSTFSDRPAGNIEINTRNLDLQGEAVISASSLGMGAGGNLTILADESVYLSGVGFESLIQFVNRGLQSGIELQSIRGGLLTNTATGKAGNTKITSPSLILENGALISTSTVGSADGGNIDVIAKNIEVSSSVFASSTTGSEIGAGNAGNITIATERLTTRDTGLISTSSAGFGNGGDLKINATESIKLINAVNDLLPSGLITNSAGLAYPGNLEINTKDFTIRGGAKVDASSGVNAKLFEDIFSGLDLSSAIDLDSPRNVIINAESIDIAGASASEVFSSSISSASRSVFPASNIKINTARLAIADQGAIEVNSAGEGRAGNLEIMADSINLNSQGSLNATTLSGQGGNIRLEVNNLLRLANNSEITTDALDIGNGGNISIDTPFIVASEGSTISARAVSGQGGNINIEATDLFLTPDSRITASSKLGIDGEVNIETFDTSDRNSLVELPETTIKTDNTIVQSCGSKNVSNGVFSYTGRGGLPANLLNDSHSGDRNTLADLDTPYLSTTQNELDKLKVSNLKLIPSSQTIVEAAAWKRNRQGNIELVAANPITSSGFDNHNCPFN